MIPDGQVKVVVMIKGLTPDAQDKHIHSILVQH